MRGFMRSAREQALREGPRQEWCVRWTAGNGACATSFGQARACPWHVRSVQAAGGGRSTGGVHAYASVVASSAPPAEPRHPPACEWSQACSQTARWLALWHVSRDVHVGMCVCTVLRWQAGANGT